MGKEGDSVVTYRLLDTGREERFLSKAICDKLGLQVSNCDTLAECTLSGESSVKVGQANVQVNAVDSRNDHTLAITNFIVVDNLNLTTTRAEDLSKWSHLKDLEIPDLDDEDVTMLISAECRKGGTEPYSIRTVLGWAVLGPVYAANILCSQEKNVNFVKYGDELSDQQMKQFLRLEDINMNRRSKKGISVEDQKALKRMENSVRVVGGHCEVGMLWKSNTLWLQNNK